MTDDILAVVVISFSSLVVYARSRRAMAPFFFSSFHLVSKRRAKTPFLATGTHPSPFLLPPPYSWIGMG